MPIFKIAEGFVDIKSKVDRNVLRRSAQDAGDESGEVAGKTFNKRFAATVQRNLDKSFDKGVIKSSLIKGMGNDTFDLVGSHGGKRTSHHFMRGFARELFKGSPEMVHAMRTGVPAVLGSPAGIAGLSVGLTFAASLASAVLASGALAAVGVGLLGLGAFGASSSEAFGNSWDRMLRSLNLTLKRSASSLVGPFVSAFDSVSKYAANTLEPRLTSIFKNLAPAIGPLFQGALGIVDSMLARIQPKMSSLTQEFLIPFSRELPRLGDMAGRFVNILIDNGPALVKGFSNALTVLDAILMAFGHILVSFAKGLEVFFAVGRAVGTVADVFIKLNGAILFLPRKMTELSNSMKENVGWIGKAGEVAKAAILGYSGIGSSADKASGSTFSFRGSTDALIVAVQNLAANNSILKTNLDNGTVSMGQAISAAGTLYDALMLLNGGVLAVRAAENLFQGAIDAATQSIKDNGKTLDVNTEKGRANRTALDSIATGAFKLADAIFQQTGSEKKATEALKDGRKALINSARQMGLNKKEAEALADEIFGIPKQWTTKFKSNANSAKSIANRYAQAVRDIPRAWTTTHTVNQVIQRVHGVNAPTVQRFGGLHANGVTYAQQGLINLRNSQMFSGRRTLFGFAEPETGGEAFIAKNAPRSRSLNILDAAARWHNAMVVPVESLANSAREISSATLRSSTATGSTVTYNFSPGSIVLDASKIKSIQDLIDMINGLQTTSRQFGAAI